MKTICIFLLLTMCAVTTAAAQDVLVVYYSRDGHTKQVAEELAKRFDADTERLIDRRNRKGPIGTARAGKDALAKNLTEIDQLKKDPAQYRIILIGTPSWFNNMTPAVRTFVAEYDLSGKKIGVFGTAHLTGVESAMEKLSALIAKENKGTIAQLPLVHKDLDEEILKEKIEKFYQEVMEDR